LGIRLYPIPFRQLDYKDRHQKFDWIETRLVRNAKGWQAQQMTAHGNALRSALRRFQAL